MKEIASTKKIIETLRHSDVVTLEMTQENLWQLAEAVQKDMALTITISKMETPQERRAYAMQRLREGNLSESERTLLIGVAAVANIELRKYISANKLLRALLTKPTYEYGDYYRINGLILTERKLGRIKQAKELAILALRNRPSHVTPRNELIHIALMEGDKEKAKRLIAQQKAFYAKVREKKTEEYRTYKRDEEETARLEEMLEGKQEQQNSK